MINLKIKDIVAGYGNLEVLHDISMQAEKNKIVGIIGPNGSGKSTLLKTIVGIIKPTTGKIFLNEEDITGLSPNLCLKKGIALVPQGRTIFPNMTVLENLQMGAFTFIQNKASLEKQYEAVYNVFPILKEKNNQVAVTLSGGEQNMLCIGRALMTRPDLLMLDEPSLGLAPMFINKIYEKLQKMKKEKTIIIVEQNVRKILSVADYIYILDLGKNKFEGKSKSFLHNKKLRILYLGG